jgi:hypothetical protein
MDLREILHRITLRLLRWRMRLRNFETIAAEDRKDFKWHKQPLAIAFVYASLPLLLYWGFSIPSPGKAVAAMAVVAAVMSLRGEMGGKEKLAWTLLLFGFLSVEIKSIDNDRTLAEQERASTVERERKGFDSVAKGIETSISNSDREFRETMSGLNKNMNLVTGGKTFCVVEAIPLPGKFVFDAIAVGPNPLHNVLTDLTDVDVIKSMLGTPQFTFDAIQQITAHYTIPFLTSGSGFQVAEVPTGNGDQRNFHFNFFSMNGMWREELKLRRLSNGTWFQAFKVSKDVPVGGQRGRTREIILCRMVPDNYPMTKDDDSWVGQHSACPM